VVSASNLGARFHPVADYVGLAFVVEPDGDETEVRASLRGDDQDWGGYLIGPADWIAIASDTEPFFEIRLPGGRSGAAFVSYFDEASTEQRVTIAGVGAAPFR
jgi:hypothetical protein